MRFFQVLVVIACVVAAFIIFLNWSPLFSVQQHLNVALYVLGIAVALILAFNTREAEVAELRKLNETLAMHTRLLASIANSMPDREAQRAGGAQ